jgi:RNA polymerase sigma factor (sigma-70 family)
MATTSAAITGDVRRLFDSGSLTGLTDGELLDQFLSRDGGSAAAFEAILTRHGPAVWSACNLHGPAALAEDAFQATFLILFRRAGTLRVSGSLAPWLVEVARRTALKAGTAERRRRAREGRVAVSESAGSPAFLPDEIAPLVRAEVDRLPAKYRDPIHLCYFEGRTHDEAAIALDWPVGTVRGRLSRARQILRTRLARRGIASAGWLAAVGMTETRGEVPASLRAATLAAATTGASAAAGVAALADQVIRGLAIAKATVAAGIAVVLLSAGAGLTAWVSRREDRPRPAQPVKTAMTRPQTVVVPHTDRYGDPLPRGATARLGTARFRQNEFDDGHAISRVLYSPDGKTLVTVGVQNGVNLWDADSGRIVRRLEASDASISADGRTLATVKQPGLVQLWELGVGKELRRARSNAEEYYSHLTFSADGKSLVAIGVINSKDGMKLPGVEFVAWDAETLTERFRLPAPGDFLYARALTFSPDGRTIAVASPDKKPGGFGMPMGEPELSSIRLLDAANGSRLRRIFIKHFDVGALAFSPDGQTLAAGIGDRTIRRYDPATGMERLPRLGSDQAQPLPKPGEMANKWYEDAARSAAALAFSPDGSKLVAGQEAIGYLNGRIDEASISVWDIASGRQVQRFFGHYGGISSLAFAPGGKTFASAGGETVARTWDLATGRETEPRPGHKGQGCEMTVSPVDGTVFTGGTFDHVVLRWDPTTGNCLGTVAEGMSAILAMDVAPDGKSILIDTWDGLMFWDIASRREIRRFTGKRPAHTGYYRAEFSPDGRTVTMGLRVWETSTGRELASFAHRQEDGRSKPYYMTARYMPDSRRLIAFEKHGIGLLDIAAGKEISRPLRAELKNEWLSVVSPDGRLVATGNFVPLPPVKGQPEADLAARVYELASGKQVVALEGHTDQIFGLAFSPDGRTIATAAGNFWHPKDRTIRIWDVATGRELRRFDNPEGSEHIEYLPDGRSVVNLGTDGVVTVWDVSAPSS